jgi:RNA-directed DNA polymerase
MSKSPKRIGVGQLAFTFGLEPKDDAQETEGVGPAASPTPSEDKSKPERKRKWHSLYDKVFALPNLTRAWARVRENAGAGGVDGQTVQQFAVNADVRLTRLSEDLRAKTYRPKPVRRVYIPKSGGGKRPLGIPCVRDRIVQQALLQVLEPIFEAKFSPRSHGFRPKRGCASALDVVDRAIRYGLCWVVDADVRAFFDNVGHEKLLCLLNEEVADGSVLRLIRQILRAGVVEPGVAEVDPTELGTPQGGPLSPLLANVYLHPLDERLQAGHYGLIRYADDFVIFAKSEGEAQEALSVARQVLEGELGLSLHPEKTRVVSVDEGFEFLGFHYFRDPKVGRCKEVRQKSVARFREAIRLRTPRLKTQRRVKRKHLTLGRLSKNKLVSAMIRELDLFVAGWHWYFKGVQSRYAETPFGCFDGFVRRRVRSAITGRTGSGWWHSVLNNALLRRLGLVPLDELQARYQMGRLAAPARKG